MRGARHREPGAVRVIPAWAGVLIAVGSFAAGAFIAWDHLRPHRAALPELPPEGDRYMGSGTGPVETRDGDS